MPIDKGVSMVIIHSPKGKRMFDSISENLEVEQTTMNVARRVQPMMTSSCYPNICRESFFKDFNENGILHLRVLSGNTNRYLQKMRLEHISKV